MGTNEGIEDLTREKEDVKEIQMEIRGQKNITTQNKVKSSVGWFDSTAERTDRSSRRM